MKRFSTSDLILAGPGSVEATIAAPRSRRFGDSDHSPSLGTWGGIRSLFQRLAQVHWFASISWLFTAGGLFLGCVVLQMGLAASGFVNAMVLSGTASPGPWSSVGWNDCGFAGADGGVLNARSGSRVPTEPVSVLGSISEGMAQDEQQNSTAKIRVQPSKMASRIGTAVNWRPTLAAAFDESRASGKPIFWYVATVPKTFTDRKIEIDRYMLAGMFSWPKLIAILNESYIPVRVPPDDQLAAEYGLVPYEFVEPGYLVIAADGTVRGRLDELTTFQPEWLLMRVRSELEDLDPQAQRAGTGAAGTGAAGLNGTDGLQRPETDGPAAGYVDCIWESGSDSSLVSAFRRFMATPKRQDVPPELSESQGSDKLEVERLMMLGMSQYYAGQHEAARQSWRQLMESFPDHPLAWKAAAEREGFGPFVRGFEVLGPLPSGAWNAGLESAGSASPEGVYAEPALWRRSVDFLLAMQRDDGSFVDSDYDFGGTDSLPNVHVAVTSLAGLALMEAQRRAPDRASDIDSAIARAAAFARDPKHLNRVDRDEILWASAYRLRFLVARWRQGQETRETVQEAVELLESVQGPRGSWYHEYANSFVTATALVALAEARQAGAETNADVIARGLAALSRDRHANGAFPYSSVRGERSNENRDGDLIASAGRMPICELALWLWDRSDDARLAFAVQQSLEHHATLRVAYKYDNHTSTRAYGGFFFWYDMRSRAEAISHLSDRERREGSAEEHRRLIRALPELDGCFVDSHELGRCYGTAMALLSLAWLDQAQGSDLSPGSASKPATDR